MISNLKNKLLEESKNYILDKISISKDDFLNFIEKRVEFKLKKEINKFKFKLIINLLLFLGFLFFLYGLIGGLIFYFDLPLFLLNLFYGFSLLIFSLFFYILLI